MYTSQVSGVAVVTGGVPAVVEAATKYMVAGYELPRVSYTVVEVE
jgi:hypothetical protein